MDFHQFLKSRSSIRRFQSQPISLEIINRILETSIQAPSAHNRQPWRFAVIQNDQHKLILGELMATDFRRDLLKDGVSTSEIENRTSRSISRITSAPVVIIICLDMTDMDIYEDPDGDRAKAERVMAIQSVAAAGLQLQLAAHAEGLASVWTCSPLFTPEATRAALDLPQQWEPQAMFLIGYPASAPKMKVRKPLEDVTKFI